MNRLPFATLLVSLAFIIASVPTFGSDIELIENNDVIRVELGGKPVIEYVKTEKPVPEGISSVYQRSGYIHPVFSPGGQEVTGDFAADHAHQHALFFSWVKTTFDREEVDFWNQAKQLGNVEHRGVTALDRQDDQVSFTVQHAFVAGTEDEKSDVLDETWKVTVHETPGDYFLFDIESVQTCASDKKLTLEKYHYGGMAVRGNVQWLTRKGEGNENPSGFQFLTSEGKNRLVGNHSRPNWVAMSGSLDGQANTLTVMSSPKNFRFPQPVRLHPTKPYFCFSPMVTASFTIEPGQSYVSRYRYLVTSTKPDVGFIDKQWQAYAEGER